jgi:hypothetical protein
MMPTTWQGWLKGLLAAFISAAANSITTVAVDPEKFNVSSVGGIQHLLIAAGVSGLVGGALYLKQSPVPPDVQTTTQTATVTKTTTQTPPPAA